MIVATCVLSWVVCAAELPSAAHHIIPHHTDHPRHIWDTTGSARDCHTRPPGYQEATALSGLETSWGGSPRGGLFVNGDAAIGNAFGQPLKQYGISVASMVLLTQRVHVPLGREIHQFLEGRYVISHGDEQFLIASAMGNDVRNVCIDGTPVGFVSQSVTSVNLVRISSSSFSRTSVSWPNVMCPCSCSTSWMAS